VICAALDKNAAGALPTADSVLCTKFAEMEISFPVYRLKKAGHRWSQQQKAEKEHFGDLHQAGARCAVVKYTACRNGSCAVKKTIKCKSVCKYAGFKKGLHVYDRCDARYCKGHWRVNKSGDTEKVSETAMGQMLEKRDKLPSGSNRNAIEAEIAVLKQQSFGSLMCKQVAMTA